MSVAPTELVALRRELALAGLGVREEEPPVPASGHLPAIGMSLAPVGDASLDVLTLRRLPLSAATARVLGGRIARLVPAVRTRRHDDCRALLRGADEHAWWERRAWLSASHVRRREVRSTLRPIVFDRSALAGFRAGGILRARDGAIARWAFE